MRNGLRTPCCFATIDPLSLAVPSPVTMLVRHAYSCRWSRHRSATRCSPAFQRPPRQSRRSERPGRTRTVVMGRVSESWTMSFGRAFCLAGVTYRRLRGTRTREVSGNLGWA